jgi:hypothetical protein
MIPMKVLVHCLGVAALSLGCATAVGQSGNTARLYCQNVGNSPPEALGDREGHAFSIGESTCRVEGGVGHGGLLTVSTIYDWDKTKAVLVSGMGVTRAAGATHSIQHTDGKMELVFADGKVVGVTGSGRGRYMLATGAASVLKGKTYSYTFKSTGMGQSVVDVTID